MLRRPGHLVPLIALLCSNLLTSCAGTHPNPHPASPSSLGHEAASEYQPSRAVLWVATSSEYRVAVKQVYTTAKKKISKVSTTLEPGTWTIILDVDETVLSNVQYEIENERAGRLFALDTWNDWCRREEATALPGARDFLESVRSLGGRIALVTNRSSELEEATRNNLEAELIPFDLLLLKSEPGNKQARFESVRNGSADSTAGPQAVLLYFGDKVHDFPLEPGSEEPLWESFGEQYLLVPNPVYGSWQNHSLPSK